MIIHELEGALGRAMPILRPHVGDSFDHGRCGTTAPRQQCSAWAVSSGRQCPKYAAVILPAIAHGALVGNPGQLRVPLCGGHFDSHRAGNVVAVIL